jgi:hypothetical protein
MEKSLQVVDITEYALTPASMQRQVNLIQEVMAQVMKSGEHYGTIPGCGNKPTLLKPGAEKLSATFHLAPKYQIQKTELGNGHREYEITCTLSLIGSDTFIGQGVGSCSTMEGKYRYRKGSMTCPECGKENTVIKGKKEYGGGWLCYKAKGGCGAKFKDDDPFIVNQDTGKVEHDNPADYYNTVLKMAKKRAHVDAILTATAASDIFTQDIEDMPEVITGAKGGVQEAEYTEINKKTPKTTKPKLIEATISETQAAEINDLCLESGTDVAVWLAHYKIKTVNDLPLISYESAIKKLKTTLANVKASE